MIVSIIGVGLIGGSIGLALKEFSVHQVGSPVTKSSEVGVKKIIGIGRNLNRLKVAKKLGAVDEITTDIKEGVKDADIVFVCLPVGLIAKTVKNIIPFCKKGAIITDIGSVKAPIVSEVEKFLFPIPYPLSPAFIGGHPIAGSEKTSVKHSFAELFQHTVVVLTPTKKNTKKSLNMLKKIWQNMGAKVKIMKPAKHDEIISFTSHLPHIVAFALVNSVDNLEFAGNGFKDTTRIASSAPEMWADIIFNNRTNVRQAIKKFKKELSKIENAKSQKELVKIFGKAKTKRDDLCDDRTLAEKTLIKFIEISRNQRKISPSVREVAKYFKVSVSTAHQHLKNLYNKGLLIRRKSQNSSRMVARGITNKK
ncbi:MAG: prephenate dehydrogenase/arogenate dehydrogenase family protein [Elusimicrobiota bacterium]